MDERVRKMMRFANSKNTIIALLGFLLAGSLFLTRNGVLENRSAPEAPLSASLTNNPFANLPGFENLKNLQIAFVANAKKIKSSVVSISQLRPIAPHVSPTIDDATSPSEWLAWLKDKVDRASLPPDVYKMENLGSGIIYDRHGHILTNHHVIEGAERLSVRLADKREYRAEVVGSDPKTDLAVIKIFSFRELPPAPAFGKADDLNVGEWIMAIGNPYGLDGSVTVGVVSGKGRNDLGMATYENFIQTDASINPGNSGGPLINLKGEVVGVNTVVDNISQVGFAIPAEMTIRIADALIQNGRVDRGWLGVGIQPLTPELASSLRSPFIEGGVLINGVDEEAPAMQAGIRRGDIIVDYNGKKVQGTKNLQHRVAETPAGTRIPIKVYRDGREHNLQIKIGKLAP
jgi:S1-C subfamily serine protease